jgi:hypothetical protein
MKPAKSRGDYLMIGVACVLVLVGLAVVAYVAVIAMMMNSFGSNK